MTPEMMVQEFRTIVGVKTEDSKGQRGLNVDYLSDNPVMTFAPNSTLFGPGGGNIHHVDGKDISAESGRTAMGDGIGFQEARPEFIPLIGFDGDVFF